MMTSPTECIREDEVLMMVSTGRWPESAPAELRRHADQCQVCRELGLAASAIGQEAEASASFNKEAEASASFNKEAEASAEVSASVPPLPSSGTVWWRAQLRARQEAARQVVRPITAAQMMAFAAMVGVAGAIFGATTQWFQRGLRTLGRSIADGVAAIPLPSVPLPQDLSSVPLTSWIILAVVGVGFVAGAAVVSWAMREE
jgi:hypothetical protein